MKMAISEALKASGKDEVPVGAVLVCDGKVVAKGHNLRETLQTPIGHAEIVTLHRASKHRQSWRLTDCTLYVTLEPCVMCAGAIVQSRVPRLVYGATDPKGGAIESLYQVASDSRLNHQVEIVGGVLADECSELLKKFFRNKRIQKSANKK